MTLVEALVAAALSLLIGVVLARTFAHVGRSFQKGEAKADLQAAGLLGLAEMTAELRRSAFGILTVYSPEVHAEPGTRGVLAGPTLDGRQDATLAFRSQDPLDPSTTFRPAPFYVIYYRDASRRALVRKTWGQAAPEPVALSPTPLLSVRRLSVSELTRICSTSNGTERVLAANVERLAVEPSSYPTLEPVATLRVTLTLRKEVASTPHVVTVGTSLAPRNQR